MPKKKIEKKVVELLNSKEGMYMLLRNENLSLAKSIKEAKYIVELQKKQEQLIKLQNWVIKNKKKIVIVFEGLDAAGKTGTIRRITEHLIPRHFRSVALNKPSVKNRNQWYFQRYVDEMPREGEIVFFDRSWYNRAVLEPVNNFCTKEEYEIFMSQVIDFENMLVKSGILLLKFYFSISKKEQAKRFEKRKNSPLKRWKMSPIDEKAQELWKEYTSYKNKMLKKTSSKKAPWIVINANDKTKARLKSINHILDTIPYQKKKSKSDKENNSKKSDKNSKQKGSSSKAS